MRSFHPLRTTLLATLGLVVPLAACGDDTPASTQPVDSVEPTVPTVPTTVSPTGTPPTTAVTGYQHPDRADDVVVSIAYEGGFMPMEAMFAQLPTLLVAGDGSQFGLGPQVAIYPGPLVPNVQVTDIGEDGVQALLALADEHGLLQQREYAGPTNIADAPDTVVTVDVGGETYVHRAYALGIDAGPVAGTADTTSADDARAELQTFVEAATATPTEDSTAFDPSTYLVRAFPVDDLTGFEIEPTVVAWPLSDVVLAEAGDCVEIDASRIGDAFVDANQLTFFEQDGVTYQLAVKPQLPGDGC